ncbi:hypothetical protein GCK32_005531 [Trichostrongylus colubriformis]|uniref:Alkylglycerol monooxygenase C-terminal domain-containing protein n=1 Tax=Trichostrongylus colubriformis TaxID=6319 RepID=A0AAN8EQB9_TRICO
MGDEHLRRCVLEELRKVQGGSLLPAELYERCGGVKATNLSIDAFMAFVGQHCSRAVKAIYDAGDENSLPRYALHVDSSRKTGTLKRRAVRSQSQSSSRGGTPDAANIRFNPRTEGFSIFCHIVRRLSSSSSDGTINWNVIRNQYRKETGRHLNAEELNSMCGTFGMTKHALLSHQLSSVVEILDSRGQILRPASPFNPKTPSPTSSRSRSSDEQLSPVLGAAVDIGHSDSNQETARRQHIVEQLRKNGVYVDENGRTLLSKEGSPPAGHVWEPNGDELKAIVIERDHNMYEDEDVKADRSSSMKEEAPANDLEKDGGGSGLGSGISIPNMEESFVRKSDKVVVESSDVEHKDESCEISLIEESQAGQETSMVTPNSRSTDSERSGDSYYLPGTEKKVFIPYASTTNDEDNVFEEDNFDPPEKTVGRLQVLHCTGELEKVPLERKESEPEPVALATPVKERIMMFEHGNEMDIDDVLPHESALPEEEASLHVKEQVDKFEHLHEEESSDALGQFDEEEVVGSVHVMETVHDLEKSDRFDGEEMNGAVLGQFHENELVKNVHVLETVHDLEKAEHHQEEALNESALGQFNENELVENVHVMETVQDFEKTASKSESAAVDHAVEVLPSKAHVQETVHCLEHELDRSMPVCDEYVNIVCHRQDAGDASMAGILDDESVPNSEEMAVDVVCHMSRQDAAASKTVTVSVGDTVTDHDGNLEKEHEPSNAQSTQIVVVDVNPCVEKPRLKESDTWEKEFVVASGSTASEISNALGEAHVSAARDFNYEVDSMEKKHTEDETASDPAVITAEQIGELGTTEELPSMPVPFPTGNNLELEEREGLNGDPYSVKNNGKGFPKQQAKNFQCKIMNDTWLDSSNLTTTTVKPFIDRIFSNTSLGHRLLERLTIVNLRHAFYLISPYETAVETLEEVPNYNVESIQMFGTFEAERKDDPPIYGLVHNESTFDQIHLQTHVLWDMLIFKGRMKNVKGEPLFPGIVNKIKAALYPPGWFPGVPVEPFFHWMSLVDTAYGVPEPEKPVVKYNPPLEAWIKLYIVGHFTLLLAIFLHFEYDRASMNYIDFSLKIAFFLVTMQTFGAFFDRKPYASSLEISRCVGVLAFFGFLILDKIGAGPHRVFLMTVFGTSALLWIGYCIQEKIITRRKINVVDDTKKVAISVISKSDSLTSPPVIPPSSDVIHSAL